MMLTFTLSTMAVPFQNFCFFYSHTPQDGLVVRHSDEIKGMFCDAENGHPNEDNGTMLVRWVHAPNMTQRQKFTFDLAFQCQKRTTILVLREDV